MQISVAYAYRCMPPDYYMLTEGALLYQSKPQVCVLGKREIAPVFLDEYCILDAKNFNRKHYYTKFGDEVFSGSPSISGQYVAKVDTQIEFIYSKELIEALHRVAFPAIHPNTSIVYYADDVSGFITLLRVYQLNGYIEDKFLTRGRQGSAVVIKLYAGHEETHILASLGEPVVSDGRFEHVKDEIIHVVKSKRSLIGIYNNDTNGRRLLRDVGNIRRSIQLKREYDITSDEDHARFNYARLYRDIIQLAPNLECLIEYIKYIKPAQFGEIPKLISECQSGNRYAYLRLVDVHLRSILRLSYIYYNTYGTDIEELFQDGVNGLFSGIAHYDKEQGKTAFSAYAGFWIKQAMQRYAIMRHSAVYAPTHIMEKVINASRTVFDHSCEECVLDTCAQLVSELQIICGSTDTQAKHVLELCLPSVSMESIIEGEEEGTPVYQYIFDAKRIDATPHMSDSGYMIDHEDERIDTENLRTEIEEAMHTLTPREILVVRRRFGFDSSPETLEEVGKDLNVTRERIRQIEAKALRRIKYVLTHNVNYKDQFKRIYKSNSKK